MKVHSIWRSIIAFSFTLAAASPSYAHWGASSPWAFAALAQTTNCTHGTSPNSNFRKVRLTTVRDVWPLDGGGSLTIDNAKIRNVTTTSVPGSALADVFVAGFDRSVPPGSFLPYMGTINDLPRNSDRIFGTVVGANHILVDLQVSCQTSDNML